MALITKEELAKVSDIWKQIHLSVSLTQSNQVDDKAKHGEWFQLDQVKWKVTTKKPITFPPPSSVEEQYLTKIRVHSKDFIWWLNFLQDLLQTVYL